MVYKWLLNSLSLFYPSQCYLCGTGVATNQAICIHCRSDMPFHTQTCRQCGIGLPHTAIASRCGECLRQTPHFHLTCSPFAYRPPVSNLITALKYQRQLSLLTPLANALTAHIERTQLQVDALLPVPLHVSKLRQRGFNQSLELARPLARHFGLPIMDQIERHKATLSQSALHASERQHNVRNAFRIRRPFHYPRVAIVDDVMTTGSTVNEIAKLLVQAGVEEIQVWCVARA